MGKLDKNVVKDGMQDNKYKTVEEIVKDKGNGVGLIYLTGSHLTNVANENSDSDYYVPSKKDFLLRDSQKGTVYKGENWEAKTFMLSHLLVLLRKSNPNNVEMFFKKPVYVSKELQPLADYLYNHREDLLYLSSDHGKRFVASSYGVFKNLKFGLSKDKEYKSSRTFGKDLYNIDKVYRYAKIVSNGKPMEQEVFLTDDCLARVLALKNTEEYNQELLDSLDLDNKLDEFKTMLDQFYGRDVTDVLDGLVDLLMLYR